MTKIATSICVAGVIAARKLTEEGITNFLIVEARDELGGRMHSTTFGAPGRQLTVEIGANWIQGTQVGTGPANPILVLARKHNISAVESDYFTSITTYDETGQVDYSDVFNKSVEAYTNLTVAAGARVPDSLVDLTARTGYSLINQKPKTPHEKASEYFQFDWEYAQTPEQSSLIASSWQLFSIDQRGFKHLIQAEAAEFLKPEQVLLNATVSTIEYSDSAVSKANGEYAICTFSLGVLQNDDVRFEPALPGWKAEAIQSMTMGTYTKIFLQFPQKFWFDTQFALYADKERGRYPVWQGLDLQHFFPGSGVVFVTVTGDYSERIEVLSDAQVQSEVLGVLRAMFPNVTIPDPTAFHFPRWFSDPLYRGSYSNWPASLVTQHHTNIRASLGRLWFAGEALSEKYFGFLHGAYFEGEATGQRVANCLKTSRCAPRPHIAEIHNTAPYDA
ncbi:amine oxidase [Multifurca ochricompacta]|uniref:Amine oxidase n=1 Tax=Multifurca ochricompacta TaxID=376703 RepID=A0AAD4QLF4_9AGAM|nr:amine oxidase [Multifurca ochricompacta]